VATAGWLGCESPQDKGRSSEQIKPVPVLFVSGWQLSIINLLDRVSSRSLFFSSKNWGPAWVSAHSTNTPRKMAEGLSSVEVMNGPRLAYYHAALDWPPACGQRRERKVHRVESDLRTPSAAVILSAGGSAVTIFFGPQT